MAVRAAVKRVAGRFSPHPPHHGGMQTAQNISITPSILFYSTCPKRCRPQRRGGKKYFNTEVISRSKMCLNRKASLNAILYQVRGGTLWALQRWGSRRFLAGALALYLGDVRARHPPGPSTLTPTPSARSSTWLPSSTYRTTPRNTASHWLPPRFALRGAPPLRPKSPRKSTKSTR